MLNRILLTLLALSILFTVGCRTGEYNVDLEIYEMMPGLLEADTELVKDLARNEDGTLMLEFEKGAMNIWLRTGSDMDVVSRQKAISDAFEIFHEQYMTNEKNLKKNGEFYRQIIYVNGWVEDVELYEILWDLSFDNPDVINNREGNFM